MLPVSRETYPPSDLLRQLFGAAAPSARIYADLLIGPGVERGLLGPREATRVWQRHILNCAVVAPSFAPNSTVCDLGSGAGLPGMVLALARADLALTLVEPMQRRVTFLTEVVARLDIHNVSVVRARAEELAGKATFDAVTARAVASLGILTRWSLPLLRPGGQLLAFKGANAAREVAALQAAAASPEFDSVSIETYGAGVVEPLTTVVRIGSGSASPVPAQRSNE